MVGDIPAVVAYAIRPINGVTGHRLLAWTHTAVSDDRARPPETVGMERDHHVGGHGTRTAASPGSTGLGGPSASAPRPLTVADCKCAWLASPGAKQERDPMTSALMLGTRLERASRNIAHAR